MKGGEKKSLRRLSIRTNRKSHKLDPNRSLPTGAVNTCGQHSSPTYRTKANGQDVKMRSEEEKIAKALRMAGGMHGMERQTRDGIEQSGRLAVTSRASLQPRESRGKG